MSKYKYILLGILIGIFIPCTAVFAQSQIKLIVNGKEIQSDVPAQVINGRTMVPAKALAEALGATVSWNAQENAVTITSNSVSVASSDEIAEPVKSETIKGEQRDTQAVVSEPEQYIKLSIDTTEALKKKGYVVKTDSTFTHLNLEKVEPLNRTNTIITQFTEGTGNYRGFILKSEYDAYIVPILAQ